MNMTDEELAIFQKAYRACRGNRRARQCLQQLAHPREVPFRDFRYYVYPEENYTDRVIFMTANSPEMKSLDYLCEFVSGQKCFIADIGANSGSFTLTLASAMGEGSRLDAFEPNPEMMQRLQHNLKLNKLSHRVNLRPEAVGHEATTATLNISDANLGQSSIKATKHSRRSVEVPMTTLNAIFEGARDYDLRLIKIDVEGFEPEAFSTLQQIAPEDRPHVILIETEHEDKWDRDLRAEFLAIGYSENFAANGNTGFILNEK